ncbi:MAG: hypothetical protein NC115_12125 [Bacteroidales bacterium]|nr:hypothetical protein [Bacteroidales bacterium]
MAEDTLINWANLRAVLQEYGQAVRNGYQDSLIRNNRLASGELLNSVEFKVTENGNTFTVFLTLEDYWEYVEYDTKPHWPPLSKILEWIKIKPVIPRPDKNGRIPSPKSLAFLIGRKISRKGTKGSHDLEKTLKSLNREYALKIRAAIMKDIETIYFTLGFTDLSKAGK